MKKLFIYSIVLLFISCEIKSNKELSSIVNDDKIESNDEIKIETHNFESLKSLLNKKDDKTYVINFWATWCKPCVEELPVFEKLYSEYKDKNVDVILVSLDFPNQIDNRLIPFIKEHDLQPRVVLMADPDQNTWIPKVSEKWSGAIPATLIYNKDTREFYEQSFSYELLNNEVSKFLKTN
ncbi:TlpA disulfide reductase family protein [Urechidicola croceus]|uniref:Thioredoxin n=1 Tax=Urechidicola croceus TaxID=1850246 RepID=A0A1D8PAZ3_9FLAO|nr:TlpA disulfide reductase family protein [Urechidicola croceus]AOW21740.1 thioredoxin [Urechidicola croceus]